MSLHICIYDSGKVIPNCRLSLKCVVLTCEHSLHIIHSRLMHAFHCSQILSPQKYLMASIWDIFSFIFPSVFCSSSLLYIFSCSPSLLYVLASSSLVFPSFILTHATSNAEWFPSRLLILTPKFRIESIPWFYFNSWNSCISLPLSLFPKTYLGRLPAWLGYNGEACLVRVSLHIIES